MWQYWAFCTVFPLILLVEGSRSSGHKQQTANGNNFIDDAYKSDLCRTLFCHKGEECVVRGQVAFCTCRTTCPKAGHYVCASDLQTYPSQCELERQACLKREKLWMISLGPCDRPTTGQGTTATPTVGGSKNPVVNTIQMPNTGTLVLGPPDKSAGVKLEYIRPPKMVKVNMGSNFDADRQDVSPKPNFLKAVTTPGKATYNYTDAAVSKCDKTDYNFLQNNLLLYFHAKYAQVGNNGELEHGKHYLVDLMFAKLDNNSDQFLTPEELQHIEQESTVYHNLLPFGCNLRHIVTFIDLDADERISKNEFLRAYGFPVALLSAENLVKQHTIKHGEQYQILCNINVPQGQRVTWHRYGRPLTNVAPNNFQFSKSGASIYLTPANLAHNGNFTCRYRSQHFPRVNQTHMVTVVKSPTVRVTPNFLLLKTGETGRLYCDFHGGHGMDPSEISWEKNGNKIPYNSTILEFKNAKLSDTGSYACVVSGFLGLDRDTSSVVVRDQYFQPEKSLRDGQKTNDTFAVLYEGGLRSFNADTCKLERVVPSSYMAPGLNRPSLCQNYKCVWSDAVVAGSLLYAALVEETALAVIDLKNGAVKQILPLDFYPKRLFYIPWKDTVWLETWHDKSGLGRTILVVHSASDHVGHGLTHALPLVSSFDSVSDIFLPGISVRSNPILYGYVTHADEERLHKVDLHKISIVSAQDLSAYKCHPQNVAFLTNVGLAVVQCIDYKSGQPDGQLVLDYLTDVILDSSPDIHGIPLATPDGQTLLSIDQETGRIFVQKLYGKRLAHINTIDELFPLTDWTLFPSSDGVYGYDLFAISSKIDFLIRVNLQTAKIEHLTTLGEAEELEKLKNPLVHRHLISTKSYVNSEFLSLVTSSYNASIVRLSSPEHLHCEIESLPEISSVVWL